jgi:hypothetical protein
MNSIRSRIERIEEALGRVDAESERELADAFARQLGDLTLAELERLEQIIMRTIETGGPEGPIIAPAECEHLRDFIEHVDRDEDAYLATVREAATWR